MENFTPISAFSGGILIGLAVALLLLFNGRIAGISGIMGGLLHVPRDELFWRIAFLLGIAIGAFMFDQVKPGFYQARENFPVWWLALGGFLVGFGTRKWLHQRARRVRNSAFLHSVNRRDDHLHA
jgi:uncharacterized membrane protein YedE/YeeE